MPLPDAARNEFLKLLGPENLRTGADTASYDIGSRTPSLVAFPGSLEEATDASRICHAYGLAVAPWGGGTRIGVGSPPSRLDVVLATERMDRVLDYQPADMTVTVEAGLPLSRLQGILREQNQFLPLDPPLPDRATVGGIAATRDTGSLRHGYGTPRDLIIGLKVADPEGQIVKGGSKVVKNVAGFDLPKLYIGSWGTLGLISEVTFRVFPLPEFTRTVIVSLPDPLSAEPLMARIMDSDLTPTLMELTNGEATSGLTGNQTPGWSLALGIDGAKEDVEWQLDHLGKMAKDHAGTRISELVEDAALKLRKALADFPLTGEAQFTVRVSLLSSDVAAFGQEAERQGAERGLKISWTAHAGSGIMTLHAQGNAAPSSIVEYHAAIGNLAAQVNGKITLERVTPELAGSLPSWPHPCDGLQLMRQIKSALDPKQLWSPGRFVL